MQRRNDADSSEEQPGQPPHSSQQGPAERRTRSSREEEETCLVRLIDSFNEIFKNKEWMVSIGEASAKIDQRLIGETYIINGPAQSGKTSLVYWALRNDLDRTAIVTVDCELYRTEMQFIQKLAREVGERIGVAGLDRRAVASENIKFSELNGAIREKGRPVVLLIRNAERLVEYRKQILLYNLLEWIATDIKKYVGLVFTTRVIYFVEHFEKRVRSRLAAKHITVLRPSVESLVELLGRRVECLCEEERGRRKSVSGTVFEKVLRALKDNKKVVEVFRSNQEFAQKDLVYNLNAMKMVFASFASAREILDFTESELRMEIARRLEAAFESIFPFMPKNLLKTCTFPEYIVMAIIHYMGVHQRTPYRFKTVYEVYLEFKQKLVVSEGMGSSFIYSKNVLERAVLKLEELNLIELDNKDESVWNCDIRCSIYPEDIEKAFKELRNLPDFLHYILTS